MSVEALAPYLAGPVQRNRLAAVDRYHIWMKVFLPLCKAIIERHFAQIDAMMSRHDEAHAKIMDGLTALEQKIASSPKCKYTNGAADGWDHAPNTHPGV